MISNQKADMHLDVTPLSCPLPLLRIKSALGRLTSGQILEVTGLMFSQAEDVEDWCMRSNHNFHIKEVVSARCCLVEIKKA